MLKTLLHTKNIEENKTEHSLPSEAYVLSEKSNNNHKINKIKWENKNVESMGSYVGGLKKI